MERITLEVEKLEDGDLILYFNPGKANARKFIARTVLEVGKWAEELTDEYLQI